MFEKRQHSESVDAPESMPAKEQPNSVDISSNNPDETPIVDFSISCLNNQLPNIPMESLQDDNPYRAPNAQVEAATTVIKSPVNEINRVIKHCAVMHLTSIAALALEGVYLLAKPNVIPKLLGPEVANSLSKAMSSHLHNYITLSAAGVAVVTATIWAYSKWLQSNSD